MNPLKTHFLSTIKHEKWATSLWLEFVSEAGKDPQNESFVRLATKDLKHIIGCFAYWSAQMTQSEVEQEESLQDNHAAILARFEKLIVEADLDDTWNKIESNGTVWTLSIEQTIHHVFTHAFYHRGQLRQRAEDAGFSDWPETDFDEFLFLNATVEAVG